MPLQTLRFKPGIIKDDTNYSSEGGWIDSDKIRFWNGKVEKLGGWQKLTPDQFEGKCRGLFSWRDLSDNALLAIGTNTHLYIYLGGVLSDVTPIVKSGTLSNKFTTVSGSNLVTVNIATHNAVAGDRIIFTTAFDANNISWSANTEFTVSSVVDTNNIKITASTNANASGTPTSSIGYQLLMAVGQETSVFEFGWGTGTWNEPRDSDEGWDVPASGSGIEVDARTWTFDNFGEDLVASVAGQPLIHWDASQGVGQRAVLIHDSLGTATSTHTDSNTPTTVRSVIISTPDRHLVALGADDPMKVAFASQETLSTWTATATNTAGDQLLQGGSKIVGAKRTRGQILIWTDTTLHSMTFRGPPFIFGFRELATGCGLGGPLAVVEINGLVYWMGINQFFVFDGSVRQLPSTVSNFVFDDFNLVQIEKVVAGLNKQHSEVFWFYCSASSNEIDKYCKYNYRENVWDVGTLSRTAWIDASTFNNNIGAGSNNFLYNHEIGVNDDESAMTSFVESADMDIGDGQQVAFIQRMIPDATITGTLNSFVKTRKTPADSHTSKGAFALTSSIKKVHPRARGRQFAIKFESSDLGADWRLGATRLDIQPDGER
tara:strand:+ start:881 stop:2686 length:1806 start_codon:yes stop_codon:yes gene_type:complete